MSGLKHKLGYFRYIAQPVIWPEIFRRLKTKLTLMFGDASSYDMTSQRDEAIEWCKTLAGSSKDALQRITKSKGSFSSLRQLYPNELQEAERNAAACPVKMGGAGNLDLLYTLCEHIKAESILETGVAYGWSSLAVLLSIQHRPSARLYSIDLPYFEYMNDRWVGVVVPEALRKQWTLFRMADREGVPRAIAKARQFDLAHYDSDKSYDGRRLSYQLVWGALKPEGILISDDIGDNLAFRDFCKEINMQPMVIEFDGKFQGVIIKQ